MRNFFDKLTEMGFFIYGIGSNRITFGTSGDGNEIEFNLNGHQSYYDIAEKVMS